MEKNKSAVTFKIKYIGFNSLVKNKELFITLMINSPEESAWINEILKTYYEVEITVKQILFSEDYYGVGFYRHYDRDKDATPSIGFLITTPSNTTLKVSLFASYRSPNQKLLAEFIYEDSIDKIDHLLLHMKDISSSYIEVKKENETILIQIPFIIS